MKKLVLITLIISSSCYAQSIKTEFGIFAGAVSMQSDYGERGHFGSNYANMGFGIGGALYLGVDNNGGNWNSRISNTQNHFRLRLELSYMKTKLIHRGAYTEGSGVNTVLYNAMVGNSTIINYGGQIEYSIFEISEKRSFDPYISIGYLANSNSPEIESELGDIDDDLSLIPSVYDDGVFLDKNNSGSLVLGLGTRLRSKNTQKKSVYIFELRWQRFNSDIVEGLVPKISGNKFNDSLFFASFGYVFN